MGLARNLYFQVKYRFRARPNPEWSYRAWFFAVARGESFAKVCKGVLNKKEAHLFLQAPAGNNIATNVYWAKAAAAGLSRDACDYLVNRLQLSLLDRLEDRLPDFLRLYSSAWPEMRGYDRDWMMDFFAAAIRDPRFSFKGRTYGSMRKHSAEWHRLSYLAQVRAYRSWTPMLSSWESRKGKSAVQVIELTNNRALSDEGRKQRHCVFSYTQRCVEGHSRIFSIRWFAVAGADEVCVLETSRLTVEVAPQRRAIVQIRGLLNSRATSEQMAIVRKWAGDFGLIV